MATKNTHQSKKAMLRSVKDKTLGYWNEMVKRYPFKRNFIQLLLEEEKNVTLQRITNNIPKGILSFALKRRVNGLNGPI